MTSVVAPLQGRRTPRGDRVVAGLFFSCAALSVVIIAAIVAVLIMEAIRFFADTSVGDFLTGTTWSPQIDLYGVLPLLAGTAMITVGAFVVGVPLGMGVAVYLSEFASDRVRRILKPTVEVLAGIPTVVMGYFALQFVTPVVLRSIFGDDRVFVFNALSGAIVVGLMIVPIVASISDDAMRAVPSALREGAYGMGATKRMVTTRVIVPAAISGIMASIVLAVSRAIGETMAVSIAAGNTPVWDVDFFGSIQTLTAYIVQTVGGESAAGSTENRSLYAVALLLFTFTFVLNMVSVWLVRRFRQEYE